MLGVGSQKSSPLASPIPWGFKRRYIADMNTTTTDHARVFLTHLPLYLLAGWLLFAQGCSRTPVAAPAAKPAAKTVAADDAASVQAVAEAGAKATKNGNGSITTVDFRGTTVSADALAGLAGLPTLSSLLLSETNVTDEHMAVVGKLASLTNLDLRGCEVTNKGIAELGGLSNLKALRLSGKNGKTDVTDDAMETIAKLPKLKVLALDFLKFAGGSEGLDKLVNQPEMSELYIGNTLVNDESLQVIVARFPKLKKLRAAASQVSNEGLRQIANMSSLEELDLSENSQIFDDGLVHLASMKQLKKLNLWRVQITDEGVKHLAGLSNLTWLNLDNVAYLSDEGLVYLKDMQSLKFLHLGSTAITDDGLHHLQTLTSLDDLKVTRTGVTEEGVAELQKSLTKTAIQLKYIEGQ